ncbi:MAG: zf-HC2 domain-containing protein [Actinomycetota bacterium]
MHCAEARADLSALLDDELTLARRSALDDHISECAECAAYRESLHRLRARLRVEPVVRIVDLTSAVLERLAAAAPSQRERPRPLVPVAAAFVAATVAGASFVGFLGGPEPVAARDLSDAVLEAQHTVETMQADVTILEHGFHPMVPERRFTGTIAFRGPESLAVHLADVTAYPSGDWMPNDVDIVVDDDQSWARAVASCPREALPACTPREPRARGITGREPFPERAPAPLDLVVPLRSFAFGAPVLEVRTRTIDGRRAIGVQVTVAQVAPLLQGLLAVGNWRPLHPTDTVALWLDEGALVPLALEVTAGTSEERRAWAARRGLEVDGPVLSLQLAHVRVDAPIADDTFAAAPADAALLPAGFSDEQLKRDRQVPTWLPAGMALGRSGVLRAGAGPEVSVTSWSHGRAWVKISATSQWTGTHLFGTTGDVVREVSVGRGRGYVDERGERIVLHADGVDVVVEGSVAPDELVRVAASLAVIGRPVPAEWDEAATVTLAELPVAYAPPEATAVPACRIEDQTSTCAFAGPGDRGFRIVIAPGDRLGPPFDVDARAVEVRGRTGRFSPSLGTLEWVEPGLVVTVESVSLGLDELIALADGLEAR